MSNLSLKENVLLHVFWIISFFRWLSVNHHLQKVELNEKKDTIYLKRKKRRKLECDKPKISYNYKHSWKLILETRNNNLGALWERLHVPAIYRHHNTEQCKHSCFCSLIPQACGKSSQWAQSQDFQVLGCRVHQQLPDWHLLSMRCCWTVVPRLLL